MKFSIVAGLASVAACLSFAGTAGAAPNCTANCNAANMQCASSGKDQTVCLRAWHQCKVGCSTSAAPTKLTVTQPTPGTVVIKSAKPAKH